MKKLIIILCIIALVPHFGWGQESYDAQWNNPTISHRSFERYFGMIESHARTADAQMKPMPEHTTSGCYDPKLRELAEMARSASAVAEDDEPKEN